MVRKGFDARHDHRPAGIRCPDGIRQDAAGWVLGALDAVEARNFAEHLLTCRACHLAVADLQPAARALLALPSPRPPESTSRWPRWRGSGRLPAGPSGQPDSSSRLAEPFSGPPESIP
jgi:anti-sigma factor RsiW